MRPRRGFSLFRGRLYYSWGLFYILFSLAGLAGLALLRREDLAYRVVVGLAIAGVGLALSAWATSAEGPRPGPAPRPWFGFFLAVLISGVRLWRPDLFLSLSGPWRDLGANLVGMFFLPLVALLAGGVSLSNVLLSSLERGWSRWSQLAIVLSVVLTLPALLFPGVLPLLLGQPLRRTLLLLPPALLQAGLGSALPEEFLYRQVLYPRLLVLLQRPTAALVGQAFLSSLAQVAFYLVQGEAWPAALVAGLVEGTAYGLFYGLLRARTGSLAVPLLVHTWVGMWAVLPR